MQTQDIEAAERRIRDSCGHVCEILTIHRTPQASCLVKAGGRVVFMETLYAENQGVPFSSLDDGTKVYGIGSLTKIVIACALCILISESERSEHPILLGDPISKHIHQLSLPKSVTIESLLLHVSGIPSLTDLLLGPDGNVWTTHEKLLEAIQNLQESGQINWPKDDKLKMEYSNAGFILAGLLIKERSSQDSIGRFLQDKLFVPLEMDHTIIADIASHDAIATPHVVTSDRTARPIPRRNYSEDTTVFAAMGIYSCTEDLAKFFEALLSAYANKAPGAGSPITANVAKMVLQPRSYSYHSDGALDGVSYGLGVCCTSLHTWAIGGNSLNRVISPKRLEQYKLGGGSKYAPGEIYYHGGSITGYECAFYLMPDTRSFIIVLTNATGLADAADFISRLMLQKLFDLQTEGDILELSRLCAEDRLRKIQSFQINGAPDIPSELADIAGSYTNKDFGQALSIYEKGGSLFATLSPIEAIYHSENKPIELAVVLYKPQTISLRTLSDEDFARLAIDIYVSWGLEFIFEKKDGRVISLQRKSAKGTVKYHRSHKDR